MGTTQLSILRVYFREGAEAGCVEGREYVFYRKHGILLRGRGAHDRLRIQGYRGLRRDMKKKVIIGSLLATACLILAIGSFLYRRDELRFIQRITRVTLPSGISEIDMDDNGEFYVTAHLILPMQTVERFLIDNRFQSFRAGQLPAPVIGFDRLQERYRKPPEDAEWHYLEGHSDGHRWNFRLDRKSGGLWMEILYPDFAGDRP